MLQYDRDFGKNRCYVESLHIDQRICGFPSPVQIEYRRHPDGHEKLVAMLLKAAKTHGMEKLPRDAQLSRQRMHTILSCGMKPQRRTIIRLCRAMMALAQTRRPMN
jgi:hypothetical protein